MRRKQHSNRHKRIRKAIEGALIASGIPFANVYDRQLNGHAVDSRRYKLTNDKGEVLEGKALQWRLDPNCPRGIYHRVKRRVSTIRHKERAGLLRELRDRVSRRLAESMEHARAAALQQEYAAVPGLQGMGLSHPAERAGSDAGELRLSDVPGAGEGSAP